MATVPKPEQAEGLEVVEPPSFPEYVPHSDKEAVSAQDIQYNYEINRYPAGEAPRRTCGCSRKIFFMWLAIAIIIISAAIGGGVGGALASRHDNSSKTSAMALASSTVSPAAVSTIFVSAASVIPSPSHRPSTTSAMSSATPSYGAYNCPSDNGTIYTTDIGRKYTFQRLCDVDWPVGVKGRDQGKVVDLQAIIAYSLDSCINQCAAQRYAGGNCSAVTYGANVTLALNRVVEGNCFLKDQRGDEDLPDDSGQVESAFLVAE